MLMSSPEVQRKYRALERTKTKFDILDYTFLEMQKTHSGTPDEVQEHSRTYTQTQQFHIRTSQT